jgi:transposase-like protein
LTDKKRRTYTAEFKREAVDLVVKLIEEYDTDGVC